MSIPSRFTCGFVTLLSRVSNGNCDKLGSIFGNTVDIPVHTQYIIS